MQLLAGTSSPWLRRLDHLICEVPNIEEAMDLFVDKLGFPEAWPVGRFWPQGRTSGVAIGGINLEFLQLDEGAPPEAQIRTLVFEPFDLEQAARRFAALDLPMELREKWEPDPELLLLRGFDEHEVRHPQLICRNLFPQADAAVKFSLVDFFVCDYSPKLKARLSPEAFANVPPVTHVQLAHPSPVEALSTLTSLFGLPESDRGCGIALRDEPGNRSEVVAIHTARGPLDFGGWPARFEFLGS